MFIGRLSFRGIYFPQMGRWAWVKTAILNRRTIFKLVRTAFKGNEKRQPQIVSRPVTEPEGQEI
jgi:hypothetical protein